MLLLPFQLLQLLQLLLLCLAVVARVDAAEASSPPIQVTLQASWNAPPLLLEILYSDSSLQAVSEPSQGKPVVLEAIDRLVAKDSSLLDTSVSAKHSPRDFYRLLVEVEREWMGLDARTHALLKLNLAMHIPSPAIQASYQLYNSTAALLRQQSNGAMPCADNGAWLYFRGRVFCDAAEWESGRESSSAGGGGGILVTLPTRLLPTDIVWWAAQREQSSESTAAIAYLYADPGLPNFLVFHQKLSQAVKESHVDAYVLRWKPSPLSPRIPLFLLGYGVELALKSTEYKVTDDQKIVQQQSKDSSAEDRPPENDTHLLHGFDFKKLAKEYPSVDWEPFRTILLRDIEETPRIQPLAETELADLGLKFASFLVKTPVPLLTLVRFTEDFPRFAAFLAAREMDPKVTAEITANQQDRAGPGMEMLWMNGLEISLETFDIFGLIQALPMEIGAVKSLESLGLTTAQAVDILIDAQGDRGRQDQQEEVDGFYNVYEEGPLAGSVFWWNNLERDSRYSGWTRNLMQLMMQSESLPKLKWNLFNAVFVVDLSTKLGLQVAANMLKKIQEDVPYRFGMVLKPLSAIGEVTARVFYYLEIAYGRRRCMEFVEKLLGALGEVSTMVTTDMLSGVYTELSKNEPKIPVDQLKTFAEVTHKDVNAKIDKRVEASRTFVLRFGLQGPDSPGAIFVNGKFFELSKDFDDTLSHGAQIYYGQVMGHEDIYRILLGQTYCKARRNPYLVTTEAQPFTAVDLTAASKFMRDVGYFKKKGESETPVTIWLMGDLNQADVQKTAAAAMAFLSSKSPFSSKARVALLHGGPIPMDKQALGKNVQALEDPSKFELVADGGAGDISISDLPPHLSALCKDPKAFSIMVNGRVIGPIPNSYMLAAEDFGDLVEKEVHRFRNLVDLLKKTPTSHSFANLFSFTASILLRLHVDHAASGALVELGTKAESIMRNKKFSVFRSVNAGISSGSFEKAPIRLVALLDPLSTTTQRMASILESLSRMRDIFYIQVILNPSRDVKELPLKRFYRYLMNSEQQFTPSGNMQKPKIIYRDLPMEPLLTLGMDVIQPWLVGPVESPYDLDNIRLRDLGDDGAKKHGISATFQLRNILVEGHCRDKRTFAPPRGLQLELATISQRAEVDTIVMANLGYYQLKANPGVWQLQIRDGRSKELYELLDIVGGGKSLASVDGEKVDVVVNSFRGALLYTRVKKRAGKEEEEILTDSMDHLVRKKEKEADNSWTGFFRRWGSKDDENKSKKKQRPPSDGKQAEINIFSVASGHLYERFLRIMILSVLEHTKHSVKFWFIENFLSPSFKNFIPYMAEKHGFQFELVTYKWPQWLRAQSEKQRMIWGYKILFLDVLFPLGLDKVIFVDADQIVRTDLKELVDMDLEGAPYGYTPFCESRKEIEGFRFWKVGYWKDHLKGIPYHISALYVVDLNRFREMAAGDRLRQQYQALSADPNSLANLDQDLPNVMQMQVPIFSLPQDWLWCETWCDDGSLKTAKTIDLCNNPMTKEAKLDRARRLLPEWTVYDDKARALFEQWQHQNQTESAEPSTGKEFPVTRDEL